MSTILVPAWGRRAVRRAVRVDCQVVRERDFKLVGEGGVDLSPEGMLVLTDAEVLTGEEIMVSFRVPRSGLYVDADATVARVVHGRRPGDKRRRALGVAFHGVEEELRAALRTSLRGLPPPLPGRARRIDYAATVHLAALD